MHLAMSMYRHYILSKAEADDEEAVETYRDHMCRRAIAKMGLGDTGDVETLFPRSNMAAEKVSHGKKRGIEDAEYVE